MKQGFPIYGLEPFGTELQNWQVSTCAHIPNHASSRRVCALCAQMEPHMHTCLLHEWNHPLSFLLVHRAEKVGELCCGGVDLKRLLVFQFFPLYPVPPDDPFNVQWVISQSFSISDTRLLHVLCILTGG